MAAGARHNLARQYRGSQYSSTGSQYSSTGSQYGSTGSQYSSAALQYSVTNPGRASKATDAGVEVLQAPCCELHLGERTNLLLQTSLQQSVCLFAQSASCRPLAHLFYQTPQHFGLFSFQGCICWGATLQAGPGGMGLSHVCMQDLDSKQGRTAARTDSTGWLLEADENCASMPTQLCCTFQLLDPTPNSKHGQHSSTAAQQHSKHSSTAAQQHSSTAATSDSTAAQQHTCLPGGASESSTAVPMVSVGQPVSPTSSGARK